MVKVLGPSSRLTSRNLQHELLSLKTNEDDGDPVPPGQVKLTDFTKLVGTTIFGDLWTGEEIALAEDRGNLLFESRLERRVIETLNDHKQRLRRIASGYPRTEAMAEMYRERKRRRQPEDEGYFIQGDDDLVPDSEISLLDAEMVNRRMRPFAELAEKMKQRREIVIVNGIRNALWLGLISASYLDLTGKLIAIDRDGWFRQPDWVKRFSSAQFECVGLRSDGVRVSERRSILVNELEARGWLEGYFKATGDSTGQPAFDSAGIQAPKKMHATKADVAKFMKTVFIPEGKEKSDNPKCHEWERAVKDKFGLSRDSARAYWRDHAPREWKQKGPKYK